MPASFGPPRGAAGAPPVLFDRWFDELRVGDVLETGERRIAQSDLDLFSLLTDRLAPRGHGPAGRGGDRVLRQRIVAGVLSLFAAADLVALDPERVIGLRRVRELRVVTPLELGDAIRIRARLAALRAVDHGRGIVDCRARVVQQRGRVVAAATLEFVWRRLPEAWPGAAAPADDEWALVAEIPV